MRQLLYNSPMVLQVADVVLEEAFLAGSIADSVGVEISGQQTDGFFNLEATGSTFNHTWE